MHDGVGAAFGSFIMFFGMLGVGALADYIKTKIKSSTERTAEQMTKDVYIKYSITWSDSQND